jgi:hypothetical protein
MLPGALAEQLRARGVDAVAVAERPELRSTRDDDLFDYAQAQGRAMVTYDDDFLTLDNQYRAEGREHCGLVVLSARRFPPGPGTVGAWVRSLEAFAKGKEPSGSFVHWLR